MKVYWGGQIVEEKEVAVSPWDLGFLRGYGVFDYVAVYNKKPFMLDAHLSRLESSAHGIGLTSPISKKEAADIIFELIEANDFNQGAIRIVLTGGISMSGILPENIPSLLIRPEISAGLVRELYEDGGTLITTNYEREFSSAKTTQYIEAVKHTKKMKAAGAVEILYTKNGHISECSRSNIFMVSGGALITPDENILRGITRSVVLEEADKLNIPTKERRVGTEELMNADEIFITGTGKKILPIVRIDGQQIASGLPGEITKKLMTAYEKRTAI